MTPGPGCGYARLVKNDKAFHFREVSARDGRGARGTPRLARRRPSAPRTEAILRAITEAGFSDTRARRAVVHALCKADTGLSPMDLLVRGRKRYARLGQVTVYRTLVILERLGLARRLHREEGGSAYAVSSQGHGHHVICRSCRRAVEFEGCTLDGVIREVRAQTGYRVEGHWLELFGVCPTCRIKGRGKE